MNLLRVDPGSTWTCAFTDEELSALRLALFYYTLTHPFPLPIVIDIANRLPDALGGSQVAPQQTATS